MEQFNGLNGTIMLNTGHDGITVGTVPGGDYGYPGHDLRVTVDIRLERAERRETYETTEHMSVIAPLDFAMTTNVWDLNRRNPDIIVGGATRDPIREVAQMGKPSRFWTPETLTQLAAFGDRWHLNGMRAACAHMTPVGETTDELLGSTPPCPVTGYRYGRAWLVEPLPAGMVAELLSLIADPSVYVHPDLTGEHSRELCESF